MGLLVWDGKKGTVRHLDGRTARLTEPPFLPFQFDQLYYDSTWMSYKIKGDRTIILTPFEMERCESWIIDAFDGGLAGT